MRAQSFKNKHAVPKVLKKLNLIYNNNINKILFTWELKTRIKTSDKR